jgi:hypothetical protein
MTNPVRGKLKQNTCASDLTQDQPFTRGIVNGFRNGKNIHKTNQIPQEVLLSIPYICCHFLKLENNGRSVGHHIHSKHRPCRAPQWINHLPSIHCNTLHYVFFETMPGHQGGSHFTALCFAQTTANTMQCIIRRCCFCSASRTPRPASLVASKQAKQSCCNTAPIMHGSKLRLQALAWRMLHVPEGFASRGHDQIRPLRPS